MNSPPATEAVPNNQRPLGQVPAENGPAGKRSYRVKVVNSIWNGTGLIRRKKAEYLVSVGRAEWVGPEQVRMVVAHPENRGAASNAAAGYEAITRTMTLKELAHLPIANPRMAYTDRSVPPTRYFRGRSGPLRISGGNGLSNSGQNTAPEFRKEAEPLTNAEHS